jgi:DNA-binding MarR family transcriptional regulator
MPERPTSSPVLALLTVSSVWEARLSAVLKDLGLSTRKYGLLAHIHASPGISFSELARLSHITVQTAHTAVRALQDEGLVQDATAHAGAASDLRATARGEAALADAESRLARLDRQFEMEAPRLAEVLENAHEDLSPHAADGSAESFS